MKRVFSTFFVLVLVGALSQKAKADERRIDNVLDVWVHVRPNVEDNVDISVTLEISLPNSTERQLVHFVDVGKVMKIYADVPVGKPMFALADTEYSAWNGTHHRKLELHIHADTKLDVGGSYSYGSGASAGHTPASHQLKR